MSGHALWAVPDDHPTAAGHFPGYPIIPGAVLLQAVIAAVLTDRPGEMCCAVPAAKFLHPVRPGDVVSIDWTVSAGGDTRFGCTISPAGPRALSGSLRFCAR